MQLSFSNFFFFLDNPRVLFKFDVKPGETTYLPYGLTIDGNGSLYSGSYGGGAVLKIDRNG